MPKHTLYAYVSGAAKGWAKEVGAFKHGSISKYIEHLIAKDSKRRKPMAKKKTAKKVTKKKARNGK